jgi:hypothetical protein
VLNGGYSRLLSLAIGWASDVEGVREPLHATARAYTPGRLTDRWSLEQAHNWVAILNRRTSSSIHIVYAITTVHHGKRVTL